VNPSKQDQKDAEGDPHFWTAIHMMKQSILNFTIRHFKISVPRLRHRIILLQDSIPRHSMRGHAQASCIQPELFPIKISCLYTFKKVLIS
jgi:hypothetical protein